MKDFKIVALAIGIGALMGLGMLGFFTALEHLPITIAGLIYFTYPAFTVAIGVVFVGTVITGRMAASVLAILLACALVFWPGENDAPPIGAVALCFAAPVTFAILLHSLASWLVPLRPAQRAGFLVWGHVLVLLPFLALSADVNLVPTNSIGWIGALGLATIASLLPQFLMALGAEFVGAERTSVIGALELLTTLSIGWVWFHEPADARMISGASLMVIAVYLAASAARRPAPGVRSIPNAIR